MSVKFQVPDVPTKDALKAILVSTRNSLAATSKSTFVPMTFTKYCDAVGPTLQSLIEAILPSNWRIDISGLSAPDKAAFLATLDAIIADWELHAITPGVNLSEAQLQLLFVVVVRP